MKIVCVNGTLKQNNAGFVARIMKLLMDECRKLSKEEMFVEYILTSKENITECNGCCTCFRRSDCMIEDGYNEIEKKLFDADIIIMGSGTYVCNISSSMKRFFERSSDLMHRRALKGKLGYVIVTACDSKMGGMVSYYLNNIMRNMGIGIIGSIEYVGFVPPNALDKEFMPKVIQSAESIIKAYEEKADIFVEPEFGINFKNFANTASPKIKKYFQRDFDYVEKGSEINNGTTNLSNVNSN